MVVIVKSNIISSQVHSKFTQKFNIMKKTDKTMAESARDIKKKRVVYIQSASDFVIYNYLAVVREPAPNMTELYYEFQM